MHPRHAKSDPSHRRPRAAACVVACIRNANTNTSLHGAGD